MSAVLGGSALLLLLPLAGTSLAAGKTVLVLPFAVDSGVKMPDAAKKIPQDIVDKLKAQGLEPVPMDKARGLFNASGKETINLETARMLGRSAGADLVVYGAYSQKGEGFAMETRLVPVGKGSPVPAHFERPSQDGFSEAARELAQRADRTLRQAAEAPTLRDPGADPVPAPQAQPKAQPASDPSAQL
ncbi:MAG: outer membrane protein assembly factor BamA, partial [Desulfovibrio sp.]|nr:outer membrane protein assembly factor BamA [Desulfovibrio sp.]